MIFILKPSKLKVLIVASEISPYSKSGGLGEVIGSLPKELLKQNVDVRVVSPKYRDINESTIEKIYFFKNIHIKIGLEIQNANIYCIADDFKIYFIGNNYYFERETYYGYDDDYKRFAFFSKASVEMLNIIDFIPDIIHFNDWQTGIGTIYLKDTLKGFIPFSDIKTIFTIHNLQYQGVFNKDILSSIGLNDNYFNDNKLKFYENVSFMKAGIIYADFITTVSLTYAKEIQTSRYGYGLDYILKENTCKIKGILNGIDYNYYNPKTDADLNKNYDERTIEFKKQNKVYLQNSLGLTVTDVPVFSIISRLAEQKGLDLLITVLDELLEKDVQLVILGMGEFKYVNKFKQIAREKPHKVSINNVFNYGLAKQIYAGSDMFLMPSLFEPCGLGQIIAMRYGTIPVVRKTGGLTDTVTHYDDNNFSGNGFLFENYDSNSLMWAINQALEFYYRKEHWRKIIYNAMVQDFSWSSSVKEYLNLYLSLKNN